MLLLEIWCRFISLILKFIAVDLGRLVFHQAYVMGSKSWCSILVLSGSWGPYFDVIYNLVSKYIEVNLEAFVI